MAEEQVGGGQRLWSADDHYMPSVRLVCVSKIFKSQKCNKVMSHQKRKPEDHVWRKDLLELRRVCWPIQTPIFGIENRQEDAKHNCKFAHCARWNGVWDAEVMTALINSVRGCWMESTKTPSSLPIIWEDTMDFFQANILQRVYPSKSYPEWCENHVYGTNRSQNNQAPGFPQFPSHAT